MEKINIYVVGNATYYTSWIDNHTLVNNLDDADVVLFTGGEDVDPSMYGKRKFERTYSNIARDKSEKEIFDKIKPNQLVLGICRGSQFLCVMNGGILVQDCSNHAIHGTHAIRNKDYEEMEITSTHHQMQYPFVLDKDDYDLLFWSSKRRSFHYSGDGVSDPEVEPEIVYYHKKGLPKCLAIQGHPEMMRKDSPTLNYLNKLLRKCLEDVQ